MQKHLNDIALRGEEIVTQLDRDTVEIRKVWDLARYNPIGPIGIAPFPLPDSEKVQTESQREKPEMENDETGNSFCTKCNQALPVAIGYRDSPSLGRAARNSSLANVSFPASSTVVRFLKKSLTTLAETTLKWISETVPNVWYFFVGLYLFSRWIVAGTFGVWFLGEMANDLYFHWDVTSWQEGNIRMPYLAWGRTWILGLPVLLLFFAIFGVVGALHHFGKMHVKYRDIKLPPGPGLG